MKKQKRDKNSRAYQRGYQAGLHGRSQEICPHVAGDVRNQWVSGWREGRCDQWDGLTGVASLHKVSAL